MADIYLSNTNNPHENLALEEYLTFNTQGEVLFLWQNDRTVVIGNHQNAWAECDLTALSADGGRLARRTTGGGAVYHDLGNLNFSFICDEGDFSAEKNLAVIVEALAELGVNATATGRNDLTVGDAKISGNAFLHRQGRALHHGTLLVNSDLDALSKYLTVSRKKLEAKGVKSVRSRVANLCELGPVSVEALKTAIINRYARTRACAIKDLPDRAKYARRAEEMASEQYLLGENPRFSLTVDGRFAWGTVTVGINAKGERVEDVAVWTDALDVSLAPRVENALKGALLSKKGLNDLALRYDEYVGDVAGLVGSRLYGDGWTGKNLTVPVSTSE